MNFSYKRMGGLKYYFFYATKLYKNCSEIKGWKLLIRCICAILGVIEIRLISCIPTCCEGVSKYVAKTNEDTNDSALQRYVIFFI